MDSIRMLLLACDIVLLQHEIPQDTIEYVIDICHENGVKGSAESRTGPDR